MLKNINKDELTSYSITKTIFKCFLKLCKYTGAAVHSAVTYMCFKMFNSSVHFITFPKMSEKEPKFYFSPERMTDLTGWSWEELKLFGTEVCECSVQRQESSVLL